ncbi:MAG: uncharacterized protein KVP18_004114 [Porospora cf. gigantea A]|uniref:uncharacterized protein n=1 Tax=Porospora cf. gigantea A TaxID=2853593 RepID=UPI00355ABC96|nr:MAG: hypothetical protein KVP18_004114 [Porospora cf. gigantea A]
MESCEPLSSETSELSDDELEYVQARSVGSVPTRPSATVTDCKMVSPEQELIRLLSRRVEQLELSVETLERRLTAFESAPRTSRSSKPRATPSRRLPLMEVTFIVWRGEFSLGGVRRALPAEVRRLARELTAFETKSSVGVFHLAAKAEAVRCALQKAGYERVSIDEMGSEEFSERVKTAAKRCPNEPRRASIRRIVSDK